MTPQHAVASWLTEVPVYSASIMPDDYRAGRVRHVIVSIRRGPLRCADLAPFCE